MCRNIDDRTESERINDGLAFMNREGVIIGGLTLDSKQFRKLKLELKLPDNPHSFEFKCHYGTIRISCN